MIDILGLGFTIGFGFALISYLIATLSGKEIPSIRKSTFIVGIMLIILFVVPVKMVPTLRIL